MYKRASYYEEYLLVKHAHALYPEFNSLSEMEKVAVLKQLRAVGRVAKKGAKKVGDAYTHAGQRVGAKLESIDLPAHRVMQQLNNAGYVANAGGAVAGATSLGAGLAVARSATKAARRLKASKRYSTAVADRAKGYQGPLPRDPYAKDALKKLKLRKKRDKLITRYDRITNEGHLGKINTSAADAAPSVYNAPGRITPASIFGF